MIGLDRRKTNAGLRTGTRATAVVIACAALLVSACSAGREDAGAPPQTGSATHPATPVTTTEPVVEPITPAERQWVKRIDKIRPRIDKPFQRNLTVTRASMQSLVRVLDSCKTSLKDAGRPGERFRDAADIARKACDRYAAAAKHLEQAIAVSDVSGAVLAGSPEEDIFNRSLDHAFAAQGNGSNVMLRAEEEADRVLDAIGAESS
jgi:hypothetical protein